MERSGNLKEVMNAIKILSHADANAEPNIGITGSPVEGKPGGDEVRAFCEDLKCKVWGGANNLPGFRAPLIGFGNEKVAPRTNEKQGAFEFSQREIESSRVGADDFCRVLAISFFLTIHIAITALFGDLRAALPGIPGVVSPASLGIRALLKRSAGASGRPISGVGK